MPHQSFQRSDLFFLHIPISPAGNFVFRANGFDNKLCWSVASESTGSKTNETQVSLSFFATTCMCSYFFEIPNEENVMQCFGFCGICQS